MQIDFLLTIAEISIALAGFAGLIVAISRRSGVSVEQAELDLGLLKNVLGASFQAAGFALLPVGLLGMELNSEFTWRLSSGCLAIALPLYQFLMIRPVFDSYKALGRNIPFSFKVHTVIGWTFTVALLVVALGFMTTPVYLAAVFYLAYCAAFSFVRVFVSVAQYVAS